MKHWGEVRQLRLLESSERATGSWIRLTFIYGSHNNKHLLWLLDIKWREAKTHKCTSWLNLLMHESVNNEQKVTEREQNGGLWSVPVKRHKLCWFFLTVSSDPEEVLYWDPGSRALQHLCRRYDKNKKSLLVFFYFSLSNKQNVFTAAFWLFGFIFHIFL